MQTVYKIATPAELTSLADAVLGLHRQDSGEAFCIALSGELGAGKTAFVQALAARLGVAEAVTSPTFTIMRSYDIEHERFDRLVHMDAYRIESDTEIIPLRLNTVLTDPRTIFCVEWPEQISTILPAQCVRLSFSIMSDETRRVVISG